MSTRSMVPRVLYVTYSDLGAEYGGGRESQALFEALTRAKARGLLEFEVFVRDVSREFRRARHVYRALPWGSVFPRALAFTGRLLSGFPHRLLGECMFDMSVRKRIEGALYDVLLTSAFIPKSASYCKARGTRVVFLSRNSVQYSSILLDEARKCGMDPRSIPEIAFAERIRTNMFALADEILTFAKSDLAKGNSQSGHLCPPIRLVPNGVDKEVFSRARPRGCEGGSGTNLTFLYLAHTNLGKGLHYLLAAWSRLPSHVDCRLVVGGTIDRVVSRLIRPMKKTLRNVEFAGRVNAQEFLAKGDVFVFPSLSEGFPKVILEALSSGLPVITTDRVGLGIVEDGRNGLLVPPANPQMLAEAIQRVIDSPDLLVRLKKSAAGSVGNHTWEAFAQSVLFSIIGGGRKEIGC